MYAIRSYYDGKAADNSRFRRQGAVFQDPFLVGYPGDPFGHANAQIHDAVGFELEVGAPGDDLTAIKGQRWNPLHGNPMFAAKCCAVWFTIGLPSYNFV